MRGYIITEHSLPELIQDMNSYNNDPITIAIQKFNSKTGKYKITMYSQVTDYNGIRSILKLRISNVKHGVSITHKLVNNVNLYNIISKNIKSGHQVKATSFYEFGIDISDIVNKYVDDVFDFYKIKK